jgi:hypothetical protein
MLIENVDIWDKYEHGYYVVVTTNIGWKKNGDAVMGRGIAAQAAHKFPFIIRQYGDECKKHKQNTSIIVYNDIRLILLPTKHLNANQPWLSWQSDSSLELIEKGLIELKNWLQIMSDTGKRVNYNELNSCGNVRVAMPLPGCGNGNIPVKKSLALVKKYFEKDNRIVICDRSI